MAVTGNGVAKELKTLFTIIKMKNEIITYFMYNAIIFQYFQYNNKYIL